MIDEVGQLWVGSNDGLHLYNPEKDNFFRFLNNFQGKPIKVHAIESLDDENVLVGTHQSGLFVVNYLTKSIIEIELSSNIEENNFLIHDIKGIFLIGFGLLQILAYSNLILMIFY